MNYKAIYPDQKVKVLPTGDGRTLQQSLHKMGRDCLFYDYSFRTKFFRKIATRAMLM